MKENMKNDTNGVGRILGHLAAEKKKAGIALCLIAVMAVMWVKVLTNKGPQSAQAAPTLAQTEVEEQIKDAMKITYLNLPIVPGRDDLISRDFFASAGGPGLTSGETGDATGGVEEVRGASLGERKGVVGLVTPPGGL